MTIKYLDPYKDDPYGKLKGDKKDTWMKVSFSDAKVHSIDNGYVIAGNFTSYSGITRSFKPEQSIESGLCALPLYNTDYDLWTKDITGKNKPVSTQPSRAEKTLCQWIESDRELWLSEAKNIVGSLTLCPDAQLVDLSDDDLLDLLKSSCQIDPIDNTGNLPTYKVFTGSYKKKGSSTFLSPSEKVKFIKDEICSSLAAIQFNSENSLGLLIQQMQIEHKDDPKFIEIYFDLLKALI